MIVARTAKHEDHPKIVLLWKQLVTEEPQAVDDIDVDSALEKWSWRLEKQIEEKLAFVVERSRKLVGFACCIGRVKEKETNEVKSVKEIPLRKRPIPEGVAYITDVYVCPEARISMAAPELMAILENTIRETGFSAIWTNTHIENRPMQAFLKRLGYVNLDDDKIPRREEHLYYKKDLL